jgi:hypothetical protein
VLVLISCTIRLSPSAYDGSAAEFRLKVLPHLKHILKILLCGQLPLDYLFFLHV